MDKNSSVENSDADSTKVATIHNVLISAYLDCTIDLELACKHFGNSVYNPEEFHCTRIDLRCKNGDIVSTSVFSTGRVQVTGGRSAPLSYRSILKVARRLRQPPLSYDARVRRVEIANMMAAYDCGHQLVLAQLIKGLKGADFEPERFPGARVRVLIPKDISDEGMQLMIPGVKVTSPGSKPEVVTAFVFTTGKVTLVGARSEKSLAYAIDYLNPYFERSQKKEKLEGYIK